MICENCKNEIKDDSIIYPFCGCEIKKTMKKTNSETVIKAPENKKKIVEVMK